MNKYEFQFMIITGVGVLVLLSSVASHSTAQESSVFVKQPDIHQEVLPYPRSLNNAVVAGLTTSTSWEHNKGWNLW